MAIAIAIPAVMIGLVGLIIMFALIQLFHWPLARIVGQIPVVGGALASGLDNFLQSAFSDAYAWADQQITVMGAVITWPIYYIKGAVQALIDSLFYTYNTINWVVNAVLPQMVLSLNNNAYYWAQQAQNNAWIFAQTVLSQALVAVQSVQNNAYLWAQNAQNNAWIFAQEALAQAIQAALNVQANAYLWAQQAAAAGVAAAQAVQDNAWAWVQKAEADALQFAQTAEADARAYTDSGVSALERQIAGVQAQDAAQLAAQAATFGGALTLVNTAVRALEDSPCIRQCDVLGSLGSEVSEIADLAFIAALMAWAGESARNPEPASDQARAVFGPAGQAAASLVQSVAGQS